MYRHKKYIDIDLYSSAINIIIADKLENCIKYDRELKNVVVDDIIDADDLNSEALVFDLNDNKGFYCYTVCFLKLNCSDRTLVHESFHIACRILGRVGSTLHDSSEENYAYFIEYVYSLIKAELKIARNNYKKIKK
jgi:hypothetical protein